MHREQLIKWARDAKRHAENADLNPMPSDESLMRAAVAFNMLTRGPYPVMTVNDKDGASAEFNRAGAIVYMAIGFDDDPPNTPERAALFGTPIQC